MTAPSLRIRTPARGRSVLRRRVGGLPYALVLPSLLVLLLITAWPLVTLVRLSLQRYGLRELMAGTGPWVGVANFVAVLTDPFFWTVLVRTVVFTAVNVGLTLLIGMGVALLLGRLGRAMRLGVTVAMVFAWAIPPLSAVSVWRWMIDYEFGVLNWLITWSGVADFTRHNWFADPVQGFGVITAVVVWGGVPFVALTLHAALTQVPAELEEAARLDGAGGWGVFRHVVLPVIKPVIVICTTLSVFWDFQVFSQVYVMMGGRPSKDYYLMAIYAYTESFGSGNYGQGAAIALLMIVIMFAATIVYLWQTMRSGEVS